MKRARGENERRGRKETETEKDMERKNERKWEEKNDIRKEHKIKRRYIWYQQKGRTERRKNRNMIFMVEEKNRKRSKRKKWRKLCIKNERQVIMTKLDYCLIWW